MKKKVEGWVFVSDVPSYIISAEEYESLESRIEELERVLRYYANTSRWEGKTIKVNNAYKNIKIPSTKRARAALGMEE